MTMDTSNPDRTISLFHEGTGRLVGKISEAELRVLQDGLEEESPEDDDYWINPESIETMSAHPDATPHLIACCAMRSATIPTERTSVSSAME
jgi:hypothetical protein